MSHNQSTTLLSRPSECVNYMCGLCLFLTGREMGILGLFVYSSLKCFHIVLFISLVAWLKRIIQTIHTYANNANVIYCAFYYLRFPLLSFTLNAVSRERNNNSSLVLTPCGLISSTLYCLDFFLKPNKTKTKYIEMFFLLLMMF